MENKTPTRLNFQAKLRNKSAENFNFARHRAQKITFYASGFWANDANFVSLEQQFLREMDCFDGGFISDVHDGAVDDQKYRMS